MHWLDPISGITIGPFATREHLTRIYVISSYDRNGREGPPDAYPCAENCIVRGGTVVIRRL